MKALVIALLATLGLLSACADRDNPPARSADAGANPEPQTALGRTVDKAMDKARAKLATENINLTSFHVTGNGKGVNIGGKDANDTRPKAEITPQGELLIEGRKVVANAQQQTLLREYRKQIEAVAGAGMDIGVAGADLGIKAATQALASVFAGGDPNEVEKRVEAEADSIRFAARKLCDRLPALLDTQQALAAAMPEFKPYATMDKTDIDDCYEDRHQVQQRVQTEVREEIRQGIRESVQAAVQSTGLANDEPAGSDTAAEAEAASTQPATR